MAMGSGAFLVQVCRYLAERLVEAWENEERRHPGEVLITPEGKFSSGAPIERLVPVDANERIAIARRVVADRCLYGVDINPMAVEMAKLSLWLITMDANRPFTFLDHAFKCGDSLLGITSLEQLENFSLRADGSRQQAFATLNLRQHIDEAKKKREELEAMPSDTPEQIAAKSALYAESEESVAKLNAAADVLMAVELKGLKERAYEIEREASADHMITYWKNGVRELQDYAKQRLGPRHCLHWALAFPEMLGKDGFSAFVGNPPFIGGKKIRGALGEEYREFIAVHVGNGIKGHADLCAYFFLQAGKLMRAKGMAGLLATNTIAQGDTREVGLDQLTEHGFTIIRAVPTAPWPGTAALEVAHVWFCKDSWLGEFILNGREVSGITSLLNEPGNVTGKPYQLAVNIEKSFIGSYVLGKGFVLTPERALELIARDPKNRDCLFPYLNGEDLNSRPDQSASRWVINFHDWPLSRAAVGHWITADEKQQKEWLRSGIVPSDYPKNVVSDYPDLLGIVENAVKPERTRKNENGDFQLRYPLYEKWWIYADKRPALYDAITDIERVLVAARVSKALSFAWVTTKQVFSDALVVLALNSDEYFSVYQSSIHQDWAWKFCSTMRDAGIRYSPTDASENFPFPQSMDCLASIGYQYNAYRQSIMASDDHGLTTTYNHFHDPIDTSMSIEKLRSLQVEMDQAVVNAYDWQDLSLDHGFHKTKQGIRYTISEAARREVLDRLLTLNHQRHAEEQAELAAQAATAPVKRTRKKKDAGDQLSMDI